MRKDLGVVPAVFPMPVLMVAAYDENGKPNVMNAAWGQICRHDRIALFIDEDHKTTQNILKAGAFTVGLANKDYLEAADYVGIASGNKVPDKWERTGWHETKSAHVNAPVIEECKLTIECKLAEVVNSENFYAIIGEIVNVAADEDTLDEKGKVDVSKLNAFAFDNFRAGYYAIGEKIGDAWRSGAELAK